VVVVKRRQSTASEPVPDAETRREQQARPGVQRVPVRPLETMEPGDD